MNVQVVAALAVELPRSRRLRGASLGVGDGTIPAGEEALVVTGACGALVPGATLGTLVVPSAVLDAEGGGPPLVPDPGLRDEIVRRARAAGIPLDERPLAQARAVVDAAAERAALAARTGAAFVDLESARWAAQAIAARRAWAVVRFVTDSPERPLARLAPVLGGDPARPPGAAQVAWRLARRPDLMLALAGLAAGFLRGRARVERLL